MVDENKFFALKMSDGFLHSNIFFSFAFDASEQRTAWHRALIDIEELTGVSYAVSFYASDESTAVFTDGRRHRIDDVISDEGISDYEKYILLSSAEFWGEKYINPIDVLLHDYKGRFIWIKIEVSGSVDKFPHINRFLLYYPAHSFVRYLPECFQTNDNSFLIRFIAIFQSMYLDLDAKIENFTTLIDPEITDFEHLRELALWLKLDSFLELEAEKLRKLVCEANDLYRSRGTKKCILRILELICDETPYIIECFQLKPYISPANRVIIEEHYGDDPFMFTIVFPRGDFIRDSKNLRIVTNILNEIKPAYTEYKLVALKQTLVLDSYTYLGLNSRLSGYEQMEISEGRPLTAHVLL